MTVARDLSKLPVSQFSLDECTACLVNLKPV
jgi:hypothetical protein